MEIVLNLIYITLILGILAFFFIYLPYKTKRLSIGDLVPVENITDCLEFHNDVLVERKDYIYCPVCSDSYLRPERETK